MKGQRKYIIVLVLATGLAILADVSAPKPINWSPSYSRHHKIPFGGFALYEMFAATLPDGYLVSNDLPIYNTIEADGNGDVENYVFVNDEFHPDETDREALLDYVQHGNTVFIAASEFGDEFLDSLSIDIDNQSLFLTEPLDRLLQRDTVMMNFVSPALKAGTPYPIRVGQDEHWFTTLDSISTMIVGETEDGKPNFIRVYHGFGAFYISLVPRAFTNFNVLSDRGREYALKALSYLPAKRTFWDEYYKAGRHVSTSPLRFVLEQPALRWACYAALIGVALFVFVYARRRQRAIPIVKPPSNTTLEFTETVGRLYYQHGDHRGIAVKKVAYFHEYLRSHLGLKASDAERDLYRRVAERSGVSEDRVRSVFGRIHHMNRTREFDARDLKGLNADLERFYADTKR